MTALMEKSHLFHLNLQNTLGDYLSAQGLKQLRIAETEKICSRKFSSLMVG